MIEIIQVVADGEGALLRLGCTCGDPALASYDCEDDQIIYCANCSEITSRERLRHSATSPPAGERIRWANVVSRAECPMVNVAINVVVRIGSLTGPGLPAMITKLSTEKCFLRLERETDSQISGVIGSDSAVNMILHAGEPPLAGETPAVLEEVMRPHGESGPSYYKLRFESCSPQRRMELEGFFEASCGLKFDWRVLLFADLADARHLRRLLLECLPMARIEIFSQVQQFLAAFEQQQADLVLVPPIAELMTLVARGPDPAHAGAHHVIILLKELTAAGLARALVARPDDVLPLSCQLGDMRRAIQRCQRPSLEEQKPMTPKAAAPLAGQARMPSVTAPREPALVSPNEDDTVRLLCLASETHDPHSSFHLKRLAAYSMSITRVMGWPATRSARLALASKLHDIGKIGVPDRILRSTGTLTQEERRVMQQHTRFGYHILQGSASEVVKMGAAIALRHHERYDGKGYPDGLAGAMVPIEAQVVSVADVFDALTTQRAYKPAWPNQRAIDYLIENSGQMFAPEVVEAFMKALPEIERTQLRFLDDFRDIWTERRRFARHGLPAVPLAMEIAIPELTFHPYHLQGLVQNISGGGLKVLLSGDNSEQYALLVSSRRYAKLHCAEAAWSMLDEASCAVIWIDYYAVPDPNGCLMGLQFQKVPEMLEEQLKLIEPPGRLSPLSS